MIVKIENLEQEKYVLECAEKDGFEWVNKRKTRGQSILHLTEGDPYIRYNTQMSFGSMDYLKDEPFITFEQFKAQREQSEFVKQSDELTRQNDLEKENEELKKKLGEIEKWGNTQRTTKGITTYEEGWRDFGIALISIFFQTPSQTEANEIIKNSSTEVLEELKKLL